MFAYRSVFVDDAHVFMTQEPLRTMAAVLKGVKGGSVREQSARAFFQEVRAGRWEKIQEADFLGNRPETWRKRS